MIMGLYRWHCDGACSMCVGDVQFKVLLLKLQCSVIGEALLAV